MIQFSCPRCNAHFQAPDTSAGQKFLCSCGQKVQIPEPPAPQNKTVLGKLSEGPPLQTPLPTALPVEPPEAIVTFKTLLCPYCNEEIQAQAIKCKHCGEYLEPVEKKTRKEKTGLMTRCFDCGKPLAVEDAVRWEVEVGKTTTIGGGILMGNWKNLLLGSSSTFSTVDLCKRCDQDREELIEKEKRRENLIGGIALGIAILAVFFIICLGLYSR